MIDMPERIVDLLLRLLQQNEGRLSSRAKSKEIKALSEEETAHIETI